MKIAMLGTRGVPACYGGFETAVEQLGKRLVMRGHQVTVYCRSNFIHIQDKSYLGMKLVKLPTIPSKHFDTIFHTLLSILHLFWQSYDVIYICGVGNSVLAWIPRLTGKIVVLNVDGADWEREKWGRFAKWYLKTSERWATKTANLLIADSRKVQEYYSIEYNAKSIFIPYGAEMQFSNNTSILAKLNLKPKEYILFVGRLVPENGAHELIEAYKNLNTNKKLVIVGSASYSDNYIKTLKQKATTNIIFTGYIFGEEYKELSSHAFLFVLTSGVGGTHPVLVEQMAIGNAILVKGIPTNIETIGNTGLSYNPNQGISDLIQNLQWMLKNPDELVKMGELAKKRANEHYSWEAITNDYENLFFNRQI